DPRFGVLTAGRGATADRRSHRRGPRPRRLTDAMPCITRRCCDGRVVGLCIRGRPRLLSRYLLGALPPGATSRRGDTTNSGPRSAAVIAGWLVRAGWTAVALAARRLSEQLGRAFDWARLSRVRGDEAPTMHGCFLRPGSMILDRGSPRKMAADPRSSMG